MSDGDGNEQIVDMSWDPITRIGRDSFKGIDIMRTVRSFDPCLPCGVHFYLGGGKELLVRHSPTFGAQVKR